MIERLSELIGKQVSFMLVGTAPAFWGPYELVSVGQDANTTSSITGTPRAVAILRSPSGNRYLVNLDHIIVAKEHT